MVDDGVEGFVVPAGDVAPLCAAMRRLLSDRQLAERLGAAGQARVRRDFSLDAFAERTLDAYRTALEIHRARRGKRV